MNCVEDEQLDRIQNIMKDFSLPWFIAGGWSIDLSVGKKTREHEDMDIVIFREHVQEVIDYFKDWEISVAIPGEHRLESVKDISSTSHPRYCLHIRKDKDFVEVLLTDRQEDRVIFRRDSSITIPLQNFNKTDPKNRPYVTPEWQLLFKSKTPRITDIQDYLRVLPHLSDYQKEWLRKALIKTKASNEWISFLANS
jgi:hypothetical protein